MTTWLDPMHIVPDECDQCRKETTCIRLELPVKLGRGLENDEFAYYCLSCLRAAVALLEQQRVICVWCKRPITNDSEAFKPGAHVHARCEQEWSHAIWKG